MTSPWAAPEPARRPATWLLWFLRCLTAGCLAAALLYGLLVERLPEPWVALLVTVAIALVAATAVVLAGVEEASGAAAPTATTMTATTTAAAVAGRPAAQAPPTTPRSGRPAPADLPVHLPARPAGQQPRQCPRCGSFATDTTDVGEREATHACRVCGRTWRTGPGIPEPDVVVRSWLHR